MLITHDYVAEATQGQDLTEWFLLLARKVENRPESQLQSGHSFWSSSNIRTIGIFELLERLVVKPPGLLHARLLYRYPGVRFQCI